MLQNTFCYFRRVVFLSVTSAAFIIGIPPRTEAQGISFSGASEAGAITLKSGASLTNVAITATPSTPAGTTNVAFVLERQGAVFLTLTSPPPYSVTFSNLTAGKYFLSATPVAAGTPPKGDLSFDVIPVSLQPVNDNLSLASVIPNLNTIVLGTNTYATKEPSEPVHGDVAVGKSIWWTWTAPSTGTFSATTMGSTFDTVLAVYTGASIGSLSEVAADDDIGPYTFSQVTFPATNGTVYYFAVDGTSTGAMGEAHLRLLANPLPTISITEPANGVSLLVNSPSKTTNTQTAASISDPSGIAAVNYWFDGSDTNAAGTLSSPYQLAVSNLKVGQYTLTMLALNNSGLINVTNAGFSVVSLAPQLITSGFQQSATQFQFGVLGVQGTNYDLEVSSNLLAWSATTHFTNFTGAEIINNTNTLVKPTQFYRAVLK
jgi:Bacterial Ig domain